MTWVAVGGGAAVTQDALANRPAADGTQGLFFASDTNELYYDDGAWNLVGPSSSGLTQPQVMARGMGC